MITTLEEFAEEYQRIKEMGWIKTNRAGPTGVGKTLEDLLGIPENNRGEPDFGIYELKAARMHTGSMLTMFTKVPEPEGANAYLRETYGYVRGRYGNGRKVLHETLTAARFVPIADTGNQLKIHCAEDRIAIASQKGVEDVYWTRHTLRNSFERKYKGALVYAKAAARGRGKNEEFQYMEACEVSGFDYDAFIALLEQGKIWVDLRIGQYPDGRTHDHGTGFRIRKCDEALLFQVRKPIV